MNKVEPILDRLTIIRARIKKRIKNHVSKEVAYVKKLIFPLKLFPLKLLVYSVYYPIRICFAVFVWSAKFLFRSAAWPFRSRGNFLKTFIGSFFLIYFFFSLLVIGDYITRSYGHYSKFLCGVGLESTLRKSLVRVVGGYSQGTGFFVAEDQIVTNFHVIENEPFPKIIFPNGTFTTPVKILGDKDADLALLFIKEKKPEMVLPVMQDLRFYENEPLISAGYALGVDMKGSPTILHGRFVAFRQHSSSPVTYIQTDINLVEGMSGGPLLEQCGKVVGINTAGLAGLSVFISSPSLSGRAENFSEQDVAQVVLDPTTPDGAVEAFYTYLGARNMEEGYKLLSSEYLKKTNFREWTNRFWDILDVRIWGTRMEDEGRNIVFVKFSTKNWVDEEIRTHYYEGTWETVLEDGVYKMNRSNIKEIQNPSWDWYYID